MTHRDIQDNWTSSIDRRTESERLKTSDGSAPWTDWLGVSASVACAIHCALMPVLVMLFPMTGLSFLADESFHPFMVFTCLLLAAVAFVPGLRLHRRLLPTGLAGIGLALIATAAFALEGECCANCEVAVATSKVDAQVCSEACCESSGLDSSEQEIIGTPATTTLATRLGPMKAWITPLGGMVLVSAHLTNRRLSNRCGCCPDHSDSERQA